MCECQNYYEDGNLDITVFVNINIAILYQDAPTTILYCEYGVLCVSVVVVTVVSGCPKTTFLYYRAVISRYLEM